MTYGIIVSGTCSPSLMKDIERIHVRAVKIIHRLPRHFQMRMPLKPQNGIKQSTSTKERFYPSCTKYSTVNAQKYSDLIPFYPGQQT